METKLIHSALFGVAIGDALGVPVEFRDRRYLKANPVTGMLAYGTHNQPAGTWSDDSSLTFCLAETLADKYDLKKLANRFINWYEHSYWTPHGEVFDVGVATSQAIYRLEQGVNPVMAGILVTVSPYPMMKKGEEVQRITMTAANTEEEVGKLIEAFHRIKSMVM